MHVENPFYQGILAAAFAVACVTGCDSVTEHGGTDEPKGAEDSTSKGDSSGDASSTTDDDSHARDGDERVADGGETRIGGTYDVGVIPATTSCPVGSAFSEIHMDDEDKKNASKLYGWVGATYDKTTFRFCRVDGSLLRPLAGASPANTAPYYAVLKMGTQCPNGSLEFSRYFDNEDHNNANSHVGDISPSGYTINGTTLVFCLFRYVVGPNPTMAAFPDYGISYGVFADYNQVFPLALAKGYIFTDDQDGSNANSYSAAADWINDAQRIIVPGGNSYLEVAKVR